MSQMWRGMGGGFGGSGVGCKVQHVAQRFLGKTPCTLERFMQVRMSNIDLLLFPVDDGNRVAAPQHADPAWRSIY